MAVETKPVPAVPEVKSQKKVLLYSIYPCMSINVGKTKKKLIELANGEKYLDTIGEHRTRCFKNHKLWIEPVYLEDQLDPLTKRVVQMGLRKMAGYGFTFVEAVRSPGIPAGTFPMSEMREKAHGQYLGFFSQALARSSTDKTVTPLTSDMVRDDLDGLKTGTLVAPEGDDE